MMFFLNYFVVECMWAKKHRNCCYRRHAHKYLFNKNSQISSVRFGRWEVGGVQVSVLQWWSALFQTHPPNLLWWSQR